MPRGSGNRGMIIYDGITPVATFMAANVARNVFEAMEQGRVEVEQFAKANAPWSDITGMAREGLTASVSLEMGGEVVLDLAHSVDYGQWLELIQNGNFAIIMPTLEALAPRIFQDAGAHATIISGGSL